MSWYLPADIVVFHGTSRLSQLIRRFSDPEERVEATHVGLIVLESLPGEPAVPAKMLEATTRGVTMRDYTGGGQVWRARNLTAIQREEIARAGARYIHRPYGWGKIALHALGLERLAFMDGYPICSWVVGAAYASQGLDFGVSHRRATPDDIEDFCFERPDLYEAIA